MTTKKVTNVPQSVWTRLVALAKDRREDPNFVLGRFTAERLLYRLSISEDRNRFVLKGAMLFGAWSEKPHRSTKDVDLLGLGSPDALVATFRRVAALPTAPDDGIRFDPDSIEAQEIRVDQEYGGERVLIAGLLGKIRLSLQVDVGFGDAITPGAVKLAYPPLLSQFPAPELKAYPPETVIAEKFEAMVKLGLANTRLKDFYDVWVLCRARSYELGQLAKAAGATFNRRKSTWPSEDPLCLTANFSGDRDKQKQWAAFLSRTGTAEKPSLEDVVAHLHTFLSKLYRVDPLEPEQLTWEPGAARWLPQG